MENNRGLYDRRVYAPKLKMRFRSIGSNTSPRIDEMNTRKERRPNYCKVFKKFIGVHNLKDAIYAFNISRRGLLVAA